MRTLNFHVRHEVNPEGVWSVLTALVNGEDYKHVTQFDRQISRLRQIGLVSDQSNPEPSENGFEIYRIGRKRLEIVWEIMHFLHYTQWQPSKPVENSMFFTYLQYCNLLYSKRATSITQYRKTYAAEITSIISSSPFFLNEMAQLSKGAVSLSTNSLIGIEHWLSRLEPKVVTEDSQFEIRNYCSPELLLLSLGYMSEVTEAQYGVDLSLTQDRRESISRLCLIDPDSLDQLLDWLYTEYPSLVQPGTKTGSYGRFIRILRYPRLKDLLQ